MSSFEQLYLIMKDGTIKQKNPFTGTEVWYVPGRDSRPNPNKQNESKEELLDNPNEEKACSFCFSNYLEATPEKSRLILENGQYKTLSRIFPESITYTTPVFRRISNLFEIVTYDYWIKNYDYKLSMKNQEWKEQYLSNEQGKNHIKHILEVKFKNFGWSQEEINKNINDDEKLYSLCNPLFGGSHELIIPLKHYKNDAKFKSDLNSSGELSVEEHYQYLKFTIDSIMDILINNRFARYVTVFQNWLEPSGASLKHLHRQLVGLDEWGSSIEREIGEIRKNKNLYNEYGTNFAILHDFIIAENDYAVAFVDYGHRYPTVAIYSKSINPRPWEHTDEELRGISDIIHSIHCAMGSEIACNEEWYYTPIDAVDVMPLHILIKWRTITHAGFEGSTKIHINPISPIQVRDILVPKLFQLRYEGKLGNLRIAEECRVEYNMLQYYKYQN